MAFNKHFVFIADGANEFLVFFVLFVAEHASDLLLAVAQTAQMIPLATVLIVAHFLVIFARDVAVTYAPFVFEYRRCFFVASRVNVAG